MRSMRWGRTGGRAVAVLAAYGFSAKRDLLKQLLDLNLAVAKAIDAGAWPRRACRRRMAMGRT